MDDRRRIRACYRELRRRHGEPGGQWSLWCKYPKSVREQEAVIIGAVLTQHTSWQNVERAMANLRAARCCSLDAVRRLARRSSARLQRLIRPVGFSRAKARYLATVANYFWRAGGLTVAARQPRRDLRAALLDVPGVGPETADAILLYALGKPSFVVDEYTQRLAAARGWVRHRPTYHALQELLVAALPPDQKLYRDFHALVVIDGQARRRRL